MAQCRFEFTLPGPETTALTEIRSHVGRAGGSFDAGRFSLPTPVGTFRGTYDVIGQSIVVEVTEKPFFVPCGAIESKLAEYVRGAR